METLPKFCPHCGTRTGDTRMDDTGWAYYKDCIPCKITFELICGDYQGGGYDEVFEIPLIAEKV